MLAVALVRIAVPLKLGVNDAPFVNLTSECDRILNGLAIILILLVIL